MASDKLRLDKAVSRSFEVSRKEAGYLIKQGAVSVDGEVCCDPSMKISATTPLSLDGNDFVASDYLKKRVFMINKPEDYVCADRDSRYLTVSSIFSQEPHFTELHCAGRLDVDTTGLVIVTDDGDLAHKITSPRYEIEKRYLAVVKNKLLERDIERFASSLKHPQEDKPYKSAKLEIVSDNEAIVTVTEGRFHEVKRLFECVGNEVLELKRLSIGSLLLDESLELGEYRLLDDDEISLMFKD